MRACGRQVPYGLDDAAALTAPPGNRPAPASPTDCRRFSFKNLGCIPHISARLAQSTGFCPTAAFASLNKENGGRAVRLGSVLAWLVLAVTVSACAENTNHLNTHYLSLFATPEPTLADFTVCHGFGCTERSRASLTLADWHKVTAEFRPRAKDAKTERQQIARAVALMERLVGPQTGTAAHQWTHKDMLILPNMGDTTQLDCVDEAVNTWTYMTLMERGNLLHFHRVANLSNAGSLTDPNMRNTAVLQEKGGGYYAVDASLVDYSVPPLVIPLATWMGHWPPDLPAGEAVAKADGKQPAHKQRQHGDAAKHTKPATQPKNS
jgi:hypothetical protein